MSVHTWGEAPHGKWLLEIHNEGRYSGELYNTLCSKSIESLNARIILN